MTVTGKHKIRNGQIVVTSQVDPNGYIRRWSFRQIQEKVPMGLIANRIHRQVRMASSLYRGIIDL